MPRPLRRIAFVVALLLAAGCSGSGAGAPASKAFSLTVTNIDGPISNVIIAGRKVASLYCWDRPTTFRPGDLGLPPLPWTVTILDISQPTNLRTLGVRSEPAGSSPDTIAIRADGIEAVAGSALPSPARRCPPAPSGEILS